MDGTPLPETLFISLLTRNRGNVTRLHNLWALMESWLMAVDRVGRHASSWSYIQGSTCNHENEGKTNNLGWMLYSVYAVLSVNSWSWHREIERDDLTSCSAIMVELWMTQREMGMWEWEQCGGYKRVWQIRGPTCHIGFGRPRIGGITRQIGTHTCHIGDGTLTRTQNSLKSQFLVMISPICSHVSLSRPQL